MQTDFRFQPAAAALRRVRNGDPDGANWVFFMHMSKNDREHFDAALIDANHPLAFQAGTQEARFRAYVEELVQRTN